LLNTHLQPSQLDAAALAYLGDAVIEIHVREMLIMRGIARLGKLNEESHKYVTAKAQAAAFRRIESVLTEEENDIFHRGRNSSHISAAPKSASMAEYRIATGMESVFGWLYLNMRQERITELFSLAYPE
jgi:ribonuclease-3 family protein